MASVQSPSRPAYAWLPVSAVALALLVVLLALANEYGFHRDELYFIVAGRHVDWGYVDQPPFTPITSAVMAWAFGVTPFAVRILPGIAVAIVIGLTAAIARDFGGARRSQVLAAVVAALSGLMGLGHLDSTTTYDVLAWTVVAWLVIRLLSGADRRLWLAVGVAAGVGLQNKHLVILLAIGLLTGLLVSRRWDVLRSGWAWASLGVAALFWLPNVAWQALNGFPQLAMGGVIAARSSIEDVAIVVPLQLLLVGPFLSPVAVAGLWWLIRGRDAAAWRAIAWAYFAVLALTLLVSGQAYYPAGLYPAIFAGGAIVLDRWLERGRQSLRAAFTALAAAASGAVIAVMMLPILPPATLANTPIPGIYNVSAEQIGWPELVATVEEVVAAMPADERERAAILTANYGEAGALTLLGSPGLPPVYSGHNSFADWGPPPDELSVAIIVAHWDPTAFSVDFGQCQRRATITNAAGVQNEELGAGVWVCPEPRRRWSELWEQLSFYG